MKRSLHLRALLKCLAVVLLLALYAGCSTRLARENVFANTETLFGISIAQNPTTQLYEARIGYARHELFYVPTSKLVTYKNEKGGMVEEPNSAKINNDPSNTPEVLAEIEVGGRSGNSGRDFQIRQRLAVGKNAVQSGAAIALMADDPATAESAAGIERAIRPSVEIQTRLNELDALIQRNRRIDPPIVIDSEEITTGEDLIDAIAARDHNDTFDNIRSRADADAIGCLIATFERELAQARGNQPQP